MAEIAGAYQRLEKVVSSHLLGLQRAMESTVPHPDQAPSALGKIADLSVLSACCNDENVLNTLSGVV